jgi:hypothetical protein
MPESEDHRGEPKSEADRTLLGVAPPRFESTEESALRSPVFVRAGDSGADAEPPRIALPSRPPAASSSASLSHAERGPARALRVARAHPVLWMVAAPALVAAAVVGLAVVTSPAPVPKPVPPVVAAARVDESRLPAAPKEAPLPSLAELEAKPPSARSAAEVLRLTELRREERRLALEALRDKVAQSPALLTDKAVQAELLRAGRDAQTAPQALAALAGAGTPLAADLLYELWAATPARTEATELARALLYTPDVGTKASPALAVALELRAAESCSQYQSALPRALKDGDKRSLLPLSKLGSRRGCGPKKAADCYACLRGNQDELVATLNAAKSRRPPTFPSP